MPFLYPFYYDTIYLAFCQVKNARKDKKNARVDKNVAIKYKEVGCDEKGWFVYFIVTVHLPLLFTAETQSPQRKRRENLDCCSNGKKVAPLAIVFNLCNLCNLWIYSLFLLAQVAKHKE